MSSAPLGRTSISPMTSCLGRCLFMCEPPCLRPCFSQRPIVYHIPRAVARGILCVPQNDGERIGDALAGTVDERQSKGFRGRFRAFEAIPIGVAVEPEVRKPRIIAEKLLVLDAPAKGIVEERLAALEDIRREAGVLDDDFHRPVALVRLDRKFAFVHLNLLWPCGLLSLRLLIVYHFPMDASTVREDFFQVFDYAIVGKPSKIHRKDAVRSEEHKSELQSPDH